MKAVVGGLLAVGLVLGATASAQAQINFNLGTPYSGPSISFGQQGNGMNGYNPGYSNSMYGGTGFYNPGLNQGYGVTSDYNSYSSYNSGYQGYTTPYQSGYYTTPGYGGYSTNSYGNYNYGNYGRRRGMFRRWR